MERRHTDLVMNRLEDAAINGCAHITWNELYCWYGVERIAARTYRDLVERWQEITGGENGELMKVEGRGGIFIFGSEHSKPVADAG